MATTIHVVVDDYGRAVVGPASVIHVLENAREDLIYLDWDCSWSPKTTLADEIIPPAIKLVNNLIESIIATIVVVAVVGASILDRIYGLRGLKSLRLRLDVWILGRNSRIKNDFNRLL